MTYPYLPLDNIDLDPVLARRLPRPLAYFHLALPIAEDDDGVTVAMAQPGNPTALRVIAGVLNTPIIPVRSPPKDIRAALDRLWQHDGSAWDRRLLVWSDTPERIREAELYADPIASALNGRAQPLFDHDLAGVLKLAHESPSSLIVSAVSDTKQLSALLNQSPVPVLLTRENAPVPPRHVLFVLRGHAPDRKVLDWVMRLGLHFQAQVTILAVAETPSTDFRRGNPLESEFSLLLTHTDQRGREIAELRQGLTAAGLSGRFLLEQRPLELALEAVIADEQPPIDLVAIAAEAFGDFVLRVLERIRTPRTAFLTVKAQD